MSESEAVWIEAENGYSLALVEGKLLCRNPKGKTLKSVPAKVKKGDAADRLLALRDWLGEHRQQCVETIERFMLRSLPVPRRLIDAIWKDPTWREMLMDAVVVPIDAEGQLVDDDAGFLRSVDVDRGVGVVNIDGETAWLRAERLALPHPVLLRDRDDFRELATELAIEQGTAQLFRETFDKPAGLDPRARSVGEFAEAKFLQLNHALGKCRTLGHRVRGGFATCTVWESLKVAEARYWIGAEYPEAETFTGELCWVDEKERTLELGDVGPVAYSEGMRMASAIYAARHIEEEGADR